MLETPLLTYLHTLLQTGTCALCVNTHGYVFVRVVSLQNTVLTYTRAHTHMLPHFNARPYDNEALSDEEDGEVLRTLLQQLM